MKRLILVSVLLAMLPVLTTAPALNAPTDSSAQVEDMAEAAEPSRNSTITIAMYAADDD